MSRSRYPTDTSLQSALSGCKSWVMCLGSWVVQGEILVSSQFMFIPVVNVQSAVLRAIPRTTVTCGSLRSVDQYSNKGEVPHLVHWLLGHKWQCLGPAGVIDLQYTHHAASSGLVVSPNPITAIPFARASGKDYFRTTIFFPANFVTLLAVIWLDGEHYFSAGTYTPNNIKL